MKIGLFGGTFNPIHNSHLYLVQQYYKQLKLDKIILMPTFVPPHKQTEDLASAEDRFRMCQIACEQFPFLEVSQYEIERGGISYTYQTLEYFTQEFPKDEWFLLMGSDMYLSLQSWKHPEIIFGFATMCAASREEGEYHLLKAQEQRLKQEGAKSKIISIAPHPISSTVIREAIKNGKSVQQYLPEGVWDYIVMHHLYGVGDFV